MSSSIHLPAVPDILKKHGLRPDKSLGQNFLTDPEILKKICSIAGVTDQDLVLEIGAGLGHLTVQLAASARRVVAVEIDNRLIPPLEEIIQPFDNVQVVQGDFLGLDTSGLIQEDNFLVVANIPYYITSRIIRNLLESDHVLLYGDPSLELRIPAGAFFPVPKVDSAVININIHPQPLLADPLRGKFFKLIKAGFLHKRKTLRNSFSKGLGWSPDQASDLLISVEIDPQRRAETLSLDEWLEVTYVYDKIYRD